MDRTMIHEDAVALAEGKAVGYYVTARDGGRTAALLGPYLTHGAAEGNVDRANDYATERFAGQGAGFWAYGVTRAVFKTGHELPAGKLNGVIGLTAGDAVAR